jgi:hypothetical protein
LSTHDRQPVVLDFCEVTDNLVGDVVEVLTSLCARLHWRRSSCNQPIESVAPERDVRLSALVGALGQDIGMASVRRALRRITNPGQRPTPFGPQPSRTHNCSPMRNS